MDKALARLTAAGRVAIGAGLLLNPPLVTRPWIGRDADTVAARVLARALGARDLVLGLGVLATVSDGDTARRWLQAAVVADATDLVVTVVHRDDLPRGGRELVMGIAAGAVAIGAKPAFFPDRPTPPS